MTPTKTSERQTNKSDGVAPETTQDSEKFKRIAPSVWRRSVSYSVTSALARFMPFANLFTAKTRYFLPRATCWGYYRLSFGL